MQRIKSLAMGIPISIMINKVLTKDVTKISGGTARLELISSVRKDVKLILDQPIIYIGAKNRGYINNLNKDNLKILGDKEDRFVDTFIASFNYMNGKGGEDTDVASWFNSRLIINPQFVPENQNRLFEVQAILDLMKLLEPDLEKIIGAKGNLSDFTFSEKQLFLKNIPIDKLSTGFVSIIKIFQEIIAGYGAWLGMIGETDIRNAEGIVLIDEIEAHLHAKWQYKIIPLLKKFFPKTTFYIATHSPLIVATTEQDEAYELVREGNQVTARKLGNPKDWYLADVYAQAFHVDFSENIGEEDKKPTLLDLLKEFSEKVKDYTIQKDADLKQNIEQLYQNILPSLGEDDPRRRSVESLKSLVQ
jgi:hypothetical protein